MPLPISIPLPARPAGLPALRCRLRRTLRGALTPGLALYLVLSAPAMAASADPAAAAPADALANYTHTMALELKGKEALVRLPLPAAVYLHARSAALQDVRVFDADGRKMAFTILDPADTSARTPASRRILPVRIFPVQASDTAGTHGPQLDVRTSSDGTLLSVTTRAPVTAARRDAGSAVGSLILDLGQDGQRNAIDALRLHVPGGTSYSARVALEVSEDLKLWQAVGETDINWLVNRSAESIASDRIEFAARPFRYARISWVKGTPLLFTEVQAESAVTSQQQAKLDNVAIDGVAGRSPNDLVYRSAIAIPVQRIGLVLPQQNMVIDGQLGRYVDVPDRRAQGSVRVQFEPLLKATFYRLEQGGATRVSGDLAVSDLHVAEWVLRVEEALTAKPTLQLGWTPSTLLFLANGRAPYQLAFGNAMARTGKRSLAQVAPGFALNELAALVPAQAGPLVAQSVRTENSSAGDVPEPGRLRAYYLWAVLLLGVVVLGAMASRLLKQM